MLPPDRRLHGADRQDDIDRLADSLTELARAVTQVNTVTFLPVMVFGTVSLIYFALCWPLSLYAGYLERRFATGMTRRTGTPLVMSAV